MIASAEIDPLGDVWFNRPLGDQRFLEPYSGLYWQINGEGHDPYLSRSLWDRTLQVSGRRAWDQPYYYNSAQFADEPLRVVEIYGGEVVLGESEDLGGLLVTLKLPRAA